MVSHDGEERVGEGVRHTRWDPPDYGQMNPVDPVSPSESKTRKRLLAEEEVIISIIFRIESVGFVGNRCIGINSL